MDETLTCPTCDFSSPFVSIVIPAHNAEVDLAACLGSLAGHVPVSHEIIVIDDASTDATAEVASSFGARLLSKKVKSGPASCRNWGVHEARGEWIFFIDADVMVHPESIETAIGHISRHSELAALFGSYDDRPHDPSKVSQFRNLLHHHVHQTGDFVDNLRRAHTFWTGCGWIRRDVFLSLGGFDHWRYRKPAIEDIEFGYRLVAAGHPIALTRDVLCKHRKKWTLRSMLRTDFMQRGLPWSLLLLRSKREANDLNVDRRQKVAALSAAAFWPSLLLSLIDPAIGLLTVFTVILLMVSINQRFYKLLWRQGGIRLAAAGLPLMHLYYLVCLSSYATAIMVWLMVDRLGIGRKMADSMALGQGPHLSQSAKESRLRHELQQP